MTHITSKDYVQYVLIKTFCKPHTLNPIRLAYKSLIAQCETLALDAGFTPHEALMLAINQPVLQNMELHHIGRHSTPGHVRLFFYSEAAAKKLAFQMAVEMDSGRPWGST